MVENYIEPQNNSHCNQQMPLQKSFKSVCYRPIFPLRSKTYWQSLQLHYYHDVTSDIFFEIKLKQKTILPKLAIRRRVIVCIGTIVT